MLSPIADEPPSDWEGRALSEGPLGTVVVERDGARYGRVSASGLSPPVAPILAAIRRALLRSGAGLAVTSAAIEGVRHEYDPVPGAAEDALEVLMNLKRLVLRPLGGRLSPTELTVKASGPGFVSGGDVSASARCEVVNPGLRIASLNPGAEFSARLYVGAGRGYRAADIYRPLPPGALPVDALFNPVMKARASETVPGEAIVEVWTTGAQRPLAALGAACRRLAGLAGVLAGAKAPGPSLSMRAIRRDEPFKAMRLEELRLSRRTFNALKRGGVDLVGEAMDRPVEELLAMRGFGETAIADLEDRLASVGGLDR